MPVDQNVRVNIQTRGVRKARSGLESIKTAAVGVAGALGAISLGRVFTGSIRLVAEFGDKMAQVQAVTGATEKQINAIRNEAKRLGATTRFTASQAAEGFIELSRAGQTAEQSIKNAGVSLKFAQANSIGLKEATLQLVATSNQFATSFQRTSDVLSKAASISATTVTELGEATKFAGSVSKAFGFSLESTAAILATFAQRGVKASSAGTALRQLFLNLRKPTTDSIEAMRRAGVTTEQFYEALRSNDLPRFIELMKKLSGEAGVFGGIAEVFGARTLAGAENLAKFGDEAVEMREKLMGASGTTKEMARVMDETLLGSLRGLNSAFEALQLQLEGSSGSLKSIVDVLRLTISVGERNRNEVIKSTKATKTMQLAANSLRHSIGLATFASTAFVAAWTGSRILAAIKGIRNLAAASVALQLSLGKVAIISGLVAYGLYRLVPGAKQTIDSFLGIGETAEKAEMEMNKVAETAQKVEMATKATSPAIKQLSEDGKDLISTLNNLGLAQASLLVKKGLLDPDDASGVISGIVGTRDAVQSMTDAMDKLNNQINPVNISLESARNMMQEIKSEEMKLRIETEDLTEKAANLEQAWASGEISARVAERGFEALGFQTEELSEKLGRLTARYSAAKRVEDTYLKRQIELKKEEDKRLKGALSKLPIQLQKTKEAYSKLGNVINPVTLSLEEAREQREKSVDLYERYINVITDSEKRLETLHNEYKKGKADREEYRKSVEDEIEVLNLAEQGIAKQGQSFSIANDRIKEAAEKSIETFERMTATLNELIGAYRKFSSFSAGKQEVETEIEASTKEISRLQRVINEERRKKKPDLSIIRDAESKKADEIRDRARNQARLRSEFSFVNRTLTYLGVANDLAKATGADEFIKGRIKKEIIGKRAGGIIPGRRGEEVPAILHGGEAVFNPTQIDRLSRLFREQNERLKTQMGGGMMGGMGVKINIQNQSQSPLTGELQSAQNNQGEISLSMIIRDAVRGEIASGSMDSVIQRRFNISR